MEIRKYHTQMTQEEINLLSQRIRNQRFDFTSYSFNRVVERDIYVESITEAIDYGQIIEYHYINGSNRVLVRGSRAYGGRQTCVVLNLTNKKIVTCYTNNYGYHHPNLDMSLYDPNINLLEAIG